MTSGSASQGGQKPLDQTMLGTIDGPFSLFSFELDALPTRRKMMTLLTVVQVSLIKGASGLAWFERGGGSRRHGQSVAGNRW